MNLTYASIAAGSALGGVARHWLTRFVAERVGEGFPWGTLVINVSGSFAIGIIAALTAAEGRWPAPPGFRLFWTAGVCGGYTTFSAFSLQSVDLLRAGAWWEALTYAGLSVACCVGAAMAGVGLGGTLRP